MATERQIAANRANAKRSTGPKSALGLCKASHNSYRHGLSCAMPIDFETSQQLDIIARDVVGSEPTSEQQMAAREFAQAQLELLRIRKVRARLLNDIAIACNNQELRRMVALDRYERFALTKRRRASHKL